MVGEGDVGGDEEQNDLGRMQPERQRQRSELKTALARGDGPVSDGLEHDVLGLHHTPGHARRRRHDMRKVLLLTLAVAAMSAAPKAKGIRLEELTWQDAEKALTPETVVVIPLGARAQEHRPHLKLENDLLMGDALAGLVVDAR